MAPRSSLPATKKRKLASDTHSDVDNGAHIKLLEDQLIAAVASKSSLNPLSDLLDIAQGTADAQVLSKAIYALYRVFVVVISNGLLLTVAGNDETKAVRMWIQEKLDAYVDLLTGLLKDEEATLRVFTFCMLLQCCD
jgi:U3 small nucleolar RNA-associated protein 19